MHHPQHFIFIFILFLLKKKEKEKKGFLFILTEKTKTNIAWSNLPHKGRIHTAIRNKRM